MVSIYANVSGKIMQLNLEWRTITDWTLMTEGYVELTSTGQLGFNTWKISSELTEAWYILLKLCLHHWRGRLVHTHATLETCISDSSCWNAFSQLLVIWVKCCLPGNLEYTEVTVNFLSSRDKCMCLDIWNEPHGWVTLNTLV